MDIEEIRSSRSTLKPILWPFLWGHKLMYGVSCEYFSETSRSSQSAQHKILVLCIVSTPTSKTFSSGLVARMQHIEAYVHTPDKRL